MIKFTTRYNLHESLVKLILLYRCDAWTLVADMERIQAFETKCLRKAAPNLIQRTYNQ